jgi:O-antigen/teichoic acid export membrane protein
VTLDPVEPAVVPATSRRGLPIRAAGEIVALGSAAFVALWINRTVGPSHAGNFAVAQSVFLLGSILISAGLTASGSQDVANNPAQSSTTWWAVTLGRFVVAGPLIVVGEVIRWILPLEPELDGFLAVVIAALIAVPIRSEWFLVATGRTIGAAGVRAVLFGSQALLSLTLVQSTAQVANLPWVIAGSAGSAAVVSAGLAGQFRPSHGRAGVPERLQQTLRTARHYLLADLSIYVYTSSDRLFLYVLTSNSVVGLYDAAYKLIQPFYSVSAVVADATYLRLARAYREGDIRREFRRYVDLMCVVTIPLGPFLLLFAPWVLNLAYGAEFSAAAPYLTILGFVITVGFMSGVAVLPFAAWNQPREYGRAILTGNVVNVLLNLFLIPPLGGNGAALATLAAKVAVTAAGLRSFYRIVRYPLLQDLATYVALSLLAAIAAWTVLAVGGTSLLGTVAFGLTYAAAAATLRFPAARTVSRHLRKEV